MLEILIAAARADLDMNLKLAELTRDPQYQREAQENRETLEALESLMGIPA